MKNITKPEDDLCLAALSWIHILLLSAGLYLLTILVFPIVSPARLLAESLWLLVPLGLGWVFIRAIRSLVLYLLCSAAVCALLAALSGSALTVCLAALLLAARCYTRVRKGQIRRLMQDLPGEAGARVSPELWEIPTFLDRPSPMHWILFVCYYAVFLFTGHERLLPWVFFLLLADLFVCFLFGYLHSIRQFIRDNQRIANLPVHSIQKTGRILLLICVILLGLIVLPSALYRREPLANLRIRLDPIESVPSTESAEMMPGGFSASDFGLPDPEASELPAWLDTLSDLIVYLITFAAAAAALAAIYRICRNALDYFAQGEEDEILFLGTEESSGVRGSKNRTRAKKERRNSPNQKIRRFYKKTILRAMKERPSGASGPDSRQLPAGWETPSELEAKAKLSPDESTEKLHTLYEKARYSREGCTKEEADILIVKNLES